MTPTNWAGVLAVAGRIVVLTALTAYAGAFGDEGPVIHLDDRTVVQRERERIEASELHQRAKANGNSLKQILIADSTKIHSTLADLVAESQEVALVHIVRNGSTLSPDGTAPRTDYVASVIRRWKGTAAPVLYFSALTGAVSFSSGAIAITSVEGFRPLENGGRYIVFLRMSQGDERKVTPHFRLSGAGVQGAFSIEEDEILPAYRMGSLERKYRHMPVLAFIADVEAAVAAERRSRSSRPRIDRRRNAYVS